MKHMGIGLGMGAFCCHYLKAWVRYPLQHWKPSIYLHDATIVVGSGSIGCHNDNLLRQKW